MRAPALLALALALLACLLAMGPAGAAAPRDRLERFRELAARRLALVEETGGRLDADAQDEIEALLDAEVLESLRSGGPFASLEFIRDRLEAFADAWGGASLRISPAGAGFLVGRFLLSAKGVGNSIRLYGRSDGRRARATRPPSSRRGRRRPPGGGVVPCGSPCGVSVAAPSRRRGGARRSIPTAAGLPSLA